MRIINQLKQLSTPLRLGLVGAGAMGKGLLYQASITPGMAAVALADVRLEAAVAAASAFGLPHRVVTTEGQLADCLATGILAVCEDAALVATGECVDVVVEASSAVAQAADYALAALARRKPVVLMNAEVDLAFGPLLLAEARRNGVVCTSCDGDQHGVIKHLVEETQLWGFELVMAGNIKGFLRRDANPEDICGEAAKRNLDPRMCASYTDGTKLCIEMALLANALGLRTAVPGMHGPRLADVREVFGAFDLAALHAGGAVVDYVLGAQPDGGVFVVGYSDQPYQRSMMNYYKMGAGPYYLFHRPYHLCHVEAMESIALAALEGEALLQCEQGFRTNVYSYAKTDLAAGTVLDGLGGFACYGMIENCQERPAGVPICLCEGVRLRRAVKQGERLGADDVAWPQDHPGLAHYREACRLGGEQAP